MAAKKGQMPPWLQPKAGDKDPKKAKPKAGAKKPACSPKMK